MRFRPSILLAILTLGTIGVLTLFLTDTSVAEKLVGSVITAIGMLGMKLLEGSNGGG